MGDRVIMVQDSGNVPLSARGVVVSINSNSLEVVFDVPFLSGTTLGDRCAPYKGATVSFVSVLNLTQPQFVCAGTSGDGDTSASVGSALERTLGHWWHGLCAEQRQRQRCARLWRWFRRLPSPNAFTPSAAQNGKGREGSTQILQRPQQRHAPVQQDVAFSGVASGKQRPTKAAAASASQVDEINRSWRRSASDLPLRMATVRVVHPEARRVVALDRPRVQLAPHRPPTGPRWLRRPVPMLAAVVVDEAEPAQWTRPRWCAPEAAVAVVAALRLRPRLGDATRVSSLEDQVTSP